MGGTYSASGGPRNLLFLSVWGWGGRLRCRKARRKRKQDAGLSRTLELGPAERRETGRMLSSGI